MQYIIIIITFEVNSCNEIIEYEYKIIGNELGH